MNLLSHALYNEHCSPMFIRLDDVKVGDPLFIGVSHMSKSAPSFGRKYILKRQFFIDNHQGYGIEELVSVGDIELNDGRSISALGVWEVIDVQGHGRVQIKPTWDYSEDELRVLLDKAGLGVDAKAVFMSYQELRDNFRGLDKTGIHKIAA